jgi:hypothetical protein
MPTPEQSEAIYVRLKHLLADLKGRPETWVHIEEGTSLSTLGFTGDGLRALSVDINKAFADVGILVTADETQACDTVGDLDDLLELKIP